MLATAALSSLAGILAVWILYPAVVGVVAHCIRDRSRCTPYQPFVSIIIATRDDPDAVRTRVENCLAGNYDPARLEVIVAVDGYASHRAEIERAVAPGVRVLGAGRGGGKAVALNTAVAASSGTVLVFTDTYQQFSADTIRQLVAPLADRRRGAVSGMLDLPRANAGGGLLGAYWRYERWLRWCEARIHSAVGVTGSVSAMRRSLWTALPSGLLLDDVYTPMRLVLDGYRVAFNPRALAFETRPAIPAQEYRRKVRTLTGVLQLCEWLPAVLFPLRNPIWAQFLFHKLLRLLTPYWLFVIVAWICVLAFQHASANLLVALAALLTLSLFGRGLSTRALRNVAQVAVLQVAVVVATANGLRGRWNVWQQ